MMKMFMIVSAKDNLKHWFPIDRIVRISEGAEGTWAASGDSKAKGYPVRSSVGVLNEDGCSSTYYSMEEAEAMVDRLELCCKLP